MVKNCIISKISKTHAVGGDNLRDATLAVEEIFQINNVKRCFPAVTLSINDNIKFLENIKQGLQPKQKHNPNATV